MAGWNGYTGTKLGRTATKEAYREYAAGDLVVLSDVQKSNINDIAKSMDVQVSPMTFLEANSGYGNIHFNPNNLYSENCQCCIAIHEARLRGLPVTAKPYSYATDSVQYLLGERFQDIWINPKTGKIPQISIIKGDSTEVLFDKLERSTQIQGRYHIGINFKNDSGHAITAERRANGKMFFYDPQNGEFLNIKELVAIESFEILKVDKLIFNADRLMSISEVIK